MNIKTVIFAIMATAFVATNANAQATISATSTGKELTPPPANNGTDGQVTATYEQYNGKKVYTTSQNTNVVYSTGSYKRNPRLTASYDVPSDLYNGNDVMINDGVEKNKKRNINYLDFNGGKVPSDGGSYNSK